LQSLCPPSCLRPCRSRPSYWPRARSSNKFLATFTVSRFLRHSAFAALGVYYGPHVLRMWNRLSRKWGTEILIVVWSIILVSAGIAFWKLYKTSRTVGRADANPRTIIPPPEARPTSLRLALNYSHFFAAQSVSASFVSLSSSFSRSGSGCFLKLKHVLPCIRFFKSAGIALCSVGFI